MAHSPARIGLEYRAHPAISARMAAVAVAVGQVVVLIGLRPLTASVVWADMAAVAAQVVMAAVPAAGEPLVAVRSVSSSWEMRRLCPTTRSCAAPVAMVDLAVQGAPVSMAAAARRAARARFS